MVPPGGLEGKPLANAFRLLLVPPSPDSCSSGEDGSADAAPFPPSRSPSADSWPAGGEKEPAVVEVAMEAATVLPNECPVLLKMAATPLPKGLLEDA